MAVAVSPFASRSDQQTAVNSLLFRGFVVNSENAWGRSGILSLSRGAPWHCEVVSHFPDGHVFGLPTSERLRADSHKPTLSDLLTVSFHHMCRLTAGLESNHRTDDGTANSSGVPVPS